MEANIEITVVRYDMYPADQPTAWCVGFVIRHVAGDKTIYRDCLVPLSEGAADGQVLTDAWNALRPGVQEWYDAIKDRPVIVGTVFVPPPPPAAPDQQP